MDLPDKAQEIKDLPDKKLLLVSEAAIYFSVHERTIRRWIKAKKIKSEKLAGSVRISRESIIEFRLSGYYKNNA